MKVNVTLDYYDGVRSKNVVKDIEDLSSSKLTMYLMTAGVASITITKIETLSKMIEKSNQEVV